MKNAMRRPVLPNPIKLGASTTHSEWRQGQDRAVMRILDSRKRFVALVLSTGSGKSLINVAAQKLGGDTCAILTSTRGLQDQVAADFAGVGLVDVRGAQNYPCKFEQFEPETALKFTFKGGHVLETAADGPCMEGVRCRGKHGGCMYFDDVRIARQRELIDTNYAYWMASHEFSDGLGKRELLVCDEAHAVPDELSRFLRIELTPRALSGLRKAIGWETPRTAKLSTWGDWAREVLLHLHVPSLAEIESGTATMSKEMRNLAKQLARITIAAQDRAGKWVLSRQYNGNIAIEPLWPGSYAESKLFLGARKVVFTSATIRPKTLHVLGLKDSDFDFIEWPGVIPVERRPVYVFQAGDGGTGRMGARSAAGELRRVVRTMDEIIAERQGLPAILHSVSYERAEEFKTLSKFGRLMLTHNKYNTAAAVAEFRASKKPVILNSPAVRTGYDFPDDEARYQLIVKVPFPDTRDAITKARCADDKEYAYYLAMQELVQMAGRIVRGPLDWGETFVIDGHAHAWFLRAAGKFAPESFLESVRYRGVGKGRIPPRLRIAA